MKRGDLCLVRDTRFMDSSSRRKAMIDSELEVELVIYLGRAKKRNSRYFIVLSSKGSIQYLSIIYRALEVVSPAS